MMNGIMRCGCTIILIVFVIDIVRTMAPPRREAARTRVPVQYVSHDIVVAKTSLRFDSVTCQTARSHPRRRAGASARAAIEDGGRGSHGRDTAARHNHKRTSVSAAENDEDDLHASIITRRVTSLVLDLTSPKPEFLSSPLVPRR